MPADPFKELLERAFAAARDSGKRDWNRMIAAVLRNRLLQLTNHHFQVQDFGSSSLIELVSRYRDLVAIDRTVKPLMLKWVGPAPASEPGTARVRADLWQAILDLVSGSHYEWDVAARRARPVPKADPSRRLPTVDAAVLATWRSAFVKAQEATLTDPRDQERLRAWLATALGRQGLPGALRARWNDYLKHEVVARLTSWFHDSGLELPDLFGAPMDGTQLS